MSTFNTSLESSSQEQDYVESLEFKIIKFIVYILILLLSTIGNSMVIYIICNARRLRVHSNMLIINLALCDILVPILSISFDLPLEENKYVWPYDAFMCKVLWPVATLLTTSAALTLAAISLDRYRQLMHPFKVRFSGRKIKIIIAVVNLIGAVSVIPYFIVLSLSAEKYCEETWPANEYRQAYTAYLFAVQYAIPLPFIVVVYINAAVHLYKSSEMIRSSMSTEVNVDDKQPERRGNKIGSISHYIRESFTVRRKERMEIRMRLCYLKRKKQTAQAIKMFMVVCTVFAFCNFPNQMVWMWSDFGRGGENPYFEKIMIFARMFTYANSVLNPWIYGFLSRDFYRGFKRIFRFECSQLKHDDAVARTESLRSLRRFRESFREIRRSFHEIFNGHLYEDCRYETGTHRHSNGLKFMSSPDRSPNFPPHLRKKSLTVIGRESNGEENDEKDCLDKDIIVTENEEKPKLEPVLRKKTEGEAENEEECQGRRSKSVSFIGVPDSSVSESEEGIIALSSIRNGYGQHLTAEDANKLLNVSHQTIPVSDIHLQGNETDFTSSDIYVDNDSDCGNKKTFIVESKRCPVRVQIEKHRWSKANEDRELTSQNNVKQEIINVQKKITDNIFSSNANSNEGMTSNIEQRYDSLRDKSTEDTALSPEGTKHYTPNNFECTHSQTNENHFNLEGSEIRMEIDIQERSECKNNLESTKPEGKERSYHFQANGKCCELTQTAIERVEYGIADYLKHEQTDETDTRTDIDHADRRGIRNEQVTDKKIEDATKDHTQFNGFKNTDEAELRRHRKIVYHQQMDIQKRPKTHVDDLERDEVLSHVTRDILDNNFKEYECLKNTIDEQKENNTNESFDFKRCKHQENQRNEYDSVSGIIEVTTYKPMEGLNGCARFQLQEKNNREITENHNSHAMKTIKNENASTREPSSSCDTKHKTHSKVYQNMRGYYCTKNSKKSYDRGQSDTNNPLVQETTRTYIENLSESQC